MVIELLLVSLVTAGATVGVLFRRPAECAIIALVLLMVPIAILFLSAAMR